MTDASARWFDDWQIGEVIETAETYTVTEASIIDFATEYDPQPFHLDPVAAAESIYGGLIASGWQSGAIMMRLLTTVLGESSMGSPGCDELRWVAPVRPGDELRLRITVKDTVPSKSKPDRGIVYIDEELITAEGQVVMTLSARLMLRRNPANVT